MSLASETVIIGKIGAPYGVKGWVKINTYTQEAQGIFAYSPWLLNDQTYLVSQWRTHNKVLIAKLDGIDSRDDAERIKNLDIAIASEQLPALSEDEFYWRELIGMTVVTDQGYNLGTVKDIFATGANDVLQVKANINDAFGQKERLLPVLFDQVIMAVDRSSGSITVDWDPAF
jgi:16S rRNA processing protein RimM